MANIRYVHTVKLQEINDNIYWHLTSSAAPLDGEIQKMISDTV